jgi:hypothetical protein
MTKKEIELALVRMRSGDPEAFRQIAGMTDDDRYALTEGLTLDEVYAAIDAGLMAGPKYRDTFPLRTGPDGDGLPAPGSDYAD